MVYEGQSYIISISSFALKLAEFNTNLRVFS